MVSFDWRAGRPSASCSEPPNDQRRPRSAMLESISWERPRPDRIAELLPDLAPADAQVVPGVGTVRKTDLTPEIDPVVARIRHEGVGEREVLSGFRIVRRFLGERDHLAVALLDLVHDLLVIDDLVLVGRRRRDEEEEVVPLPRRRLGRAAGVDLRRRPCGRRSRRSRASRPTPSCRRRRTTRRSPGRSGSTAGSSASSLPETTSSLPERRRGPARRPPRAPSPPPSGIGAGISGRAVLSSCPACPPYTARHGASPRKHRSASL